MANVTSDYLLWLWEKNKGKYFSGEGYMRNVNGYIEDNLEDIKNGV